MKMNVRWAKSVRLVAFVLIAALTAFGVAATVWAQAGGGAAGGGAAGGGAAGGGAAEPPEQPALGTIIIVKDAVPNDPEDFTFSGSGSIGPFSLDDDANPALPNTRTFANLPPGTYTVTENPLPGQGLPGLQSWYLLPPSLCNYPDGTTIAHGSIATINLAAGATVTCTFTNYKAGRVIVDKVTVPAGDPQVFQFTAGYQPNFSLTDTAPPNDSGLINPGSFLLNEIPVSGWTTSIACTDPDGGTVVGPTSANPSVPPTGVTIDLDPGETITCTYTNSKIDVRAPDLEIKKVGVVSGQTVTYTLTVTNVGTMPTFGALVNDVLSPAPPGSQFVSASGTGWTCTGAPGPGPVDCTYGSILAPSDPALTITIVVNVGPSGGDFENCATVSHEATAAVPPDSNLGNNKACVKASVLPPCPAPVTTIFTAGVKDNFSTANGPELSSPSAALQAYMNNYSGGYPTNAQHFDGTTIDRVFGHTFTGLPPGITGAKLEIGLRAIGGGSNDSINLSFTTPPDTFAWGGAIAGLTGLPWTTGNSAVLTLDLAALPGGQNILSNINANNTLDVYVQDDTAVDYIILTIVTCPGKIVIIKDTAPDDRQDFGFAGSLGQFFLDDDSDPTLLNTKTFANLPPGVYTVTETALGGWVSSVACKDPDGGTAVGGASAKIDLDAGETVTCTFTNKFVPTTTYIYSVKIVCGTVRPPRPKPDIPTLRDPSPVVPGLYRTAVNIHNFWDEATAFQHKVAIALPLDQPRGPVTRLVDAKLGPNEALEVDCHNVVAMLGGATSAVAEFLKGFLVIESPVELEVTSVYTAEELQENGISIDVEQIQPHVRRNERPTAPALPAPR